MNLLIIASAILAATVTSKNLEEVYSDEKVVTAVSFDGLASAASVSASIASATNGLASQSSLTSLSSRVDAVSNAIPTTVSALSDAGDYLKTADLAAKETDPKWTAWRKGSNVSLGKYASTPDQDWDTGASLTLQTAIGINAKTKANMASAFGYLAYADVEKSVAFAVEPSKFYLNSQNTSLNPGSTARTLQSYLDERATTNALAAVEKSVKANADAIDVEANERLENFRSVNEAIAANKGSIEANTDKISKVKSDVSDVLDIASQALGDADTAQKAADANTKSIAAVSNAIPVISATDPAFSNAVLAVGLNIDTNAVAQINELLTDGAKLPTSGVATVGGLLAALAAGLAALKKSVSTLSAKVDDANAALEEVA